MNWKRIWTGTLAAGLVIFFLQMVAVSIYGHISGSGFSLRGLPFGFIGGEALLRGFFCSCLYAVSRPRLGPGPKTALIVGTGIYLIQYGLQFFGILVTIIAVRHVEPLQVVQVCLAWVNYIAATYVAGWQYIEKAP